MRKKNNILNIPNSISFLRILLCFPLITYLDKIPNKISYQDISAHTFDLYMILVIVCLIIITDVLDGLAARALNNVTNFGKLIDPVADKMAILIIVVYLTQKPGIEGSAIMLFFLFLIMRDLYIGLYAIYFIKRYNITFDSIKSGKWFIGATTVTFFFFIYDPLLIKFSYIKWYFYGLTLLLMIYSTYEYYERYVKAYIKSK